MFNGFLDYCVNLNKLFVLSFLTLKCHVVCVIIHHICGGQQPSVIANGYFVVSKYLSDVTIVVDYYMIHDDTAIIDDPSNVNNARYAYMPVDIKDETGNSTVVPEDPDDEDKASQKKEVDKATVYTYAIAFVKINGSAEPLEGVKF